MRGVILAPSRGVKHSASELDHRYDIAIIGGGPAGLSAAIWSARYGHSVAVIDSGDPRSWESRGVNGYLGLPGIRPAQLRGSGRDELRTYGVTLIDAAVLRIEPREEGLHAAHAEDAEGEDCEFLVHIEGGTTARALRILLAFGMRDVWPEIPGLEHVYGANAHVCPDCDGYDSRDKQVAVIGHGKRAVAMALALTTWTPHITICTNGRPHDIEERELTKKLQACGITVRTESITRVHHHGRMISCLEMEGGASLDVDKVFFTIAQFPADDLGVQLGCERDHGGHIVISEHHATSVRSVFAAGDITPGAQLAIRASAGGALAAMAIHRSLLPSHRRLS